MDQEIERKVDWESEYVSFVLVHFVFVLCIGPKEGSPLQRVDRKSNHFSSSGKVLFLHISNFSVLIFDVSGSAKISEKS